ncbi:TPA: host cell division inhibitor Icd-like protein [Yersinia enterocolitica]
MNSTNRVPTRKSTIAPAVIIVNGLNYDNAVSPVEYKFLFLAVLRADIQAKPHREEIIAPSYSAAKMIMARYHVAAYAGRVPVKARYYAS